MTKEGRELLLKDLCARLPHKQKVCYKIRTSSEEITATLSGALLDYFKTEEIKVVRPYLRPLSSMTEKEKEELRDKNIFIAISTQGTVETTIDGFDWLNKNMFDYRGLIPMGLALEATKDMYK